jgi:glutamate 5-kinase
MKSKVEAARICMDDKVRLLITGKKEISKLGNLYDSDTKIKGTWFY